MAYNLTIAVLPADSGYTTPAAGTHAYEMGAIVSVTAHPYSGYEFNYWEISGREPYPAPTYMFAMPGNISLIAHFRVAGSRLILGVRPGAKKTATATMTNPTSKALSYDSKLFLGVAAVVSSEQSFHLNAGESRGVSFPIVAPAEPGTYPVYLSVASASKPLALFRGEQDMVVASVSDLLYQYQAKLEEAISKVERNYPYDWIMIPGYGLQYAYLAVPQIKELMVIEATTLGFIVSSADAYFVRSYMYHKDGTLIVPPYLSCPYCSERFTSEAALSAHIQTAHSDILSTKASITSVVSHLVLIKGGSYWWEGKLRYYPDYYELQGMIVTWRNDSPFAIQGHVDMEVLSSWGEYLQGWLFASQNQDALLSPGQSVGVYFPLTSFVQNPAYYPGAWGRCLATLSLAGAPLPGLFLDKLGGYFDWPEE